MGNAAMQTLQEDRLKKVIGLGGVISISVGQIIGAGIMALTGVGIGMTGGSIVMVFLSSSFLARADLTGDVCPLFW
jgi:hypothetical protein